MSSDRNINMIPYASHSHESAGPVIVTSPGPHPSSLMSYGQRKELISAACKNVQGAENVRTLAVSQKDQAHQEIQHDWVKAGGRNFEDWESTVKAINTMASCSEPMVKPETVHPLLRLIDKSEQDFASAKSTRRDLQDTADFLISKAGYSLEYTTAKGAIARLAEWKARATSENPLEDFSRLMRPIELSTVTRQAKTKETLLGISQVGLIARCQGGKLKETLEKAERDRAEGLIDWGTWRSQVIEELHSLDANALEAPSYTPPQSVYGDNLVKIQDDIREQRQGLSLDALRRSTQTSGLPPTASSFAPNVPDRSNRQLTTSHTNKTDAAPSIDRYKPFDTHDKCSLTHEQRMLCETWTCWKARESINDTGHRMMISLQKAFLDESQGNQQPTETWPVTSKRLLSAAQGSNQYEKLSGLANRYDKIRSDYLRVCSQLEDTAVDYLRRAGHTTRFKGGRSDIAKISESTLCKDTDPQVSFVDPLDAVITGMECSEKSQIRSQGLSPSVLNLRRHQSPSLNSHMSPLDSKDSPSQRRKPRDPLTQLLCAETPLDLSCVNLPTNITEDNWEEAMKQFSGVFDSPPSTCTHTPITSDGRHETGHDATLGQISRLPVLDESTDPLTAGLMFAIYSNAKARNNVSRKAKNVVSILEKYAASSMSEIKPLLTDMEDPAWDRLRGQIEQVHRKAKAITTSLAETANACSERAGYFKTLDDRTLEEIGSLEVSGRSDLEAQVLSVVKSVRSKLGARQIDESADIPPGHLIGEYDRLRWTGQMDDHGSHHQPWAQMTEDPSLVSELNKLLHTGQMEPSMMLPPLSTWTGSLADAASDIEDLHRAHTDAATDAGDAGWHVNSADVANGNGRVWGLHRGARR